MKSISLTGIKGQNLKALVDDTDYAELISHNWFLSDGYACRYAGKNKQISMHRSILAPPVGYKVDHINRNRLDNRRVNIRVCTHSENMHNKDRLGKLMKGVTYRVKSGKFAAHIQKDKKQIFLGHYSHELEAHKAYCEKALELYGIV